MGFYFRKSISVGGLRFNLSKSGIGVSTGFRGFRIGTGPRGNYVSIGAGGLYYRKTFPTSSSRVVQPVGSGPQYQWPPVKAAPQLGLGQAQVIDSAHAAAMVPSHSAELLNEIAMKQKLIRVFPASIVLGAAAVLAVLLLTSPWLLLVVAAVFIPLCLYAWRFDALRRTVVLFYNLDATAEAVYDELHMAVRQLAACGGVWLIEQTTAVLNGKYHSGADSLVTRKRIHLGVSCPPIIKTNIEVPAFPVGRQTLYFFPDRVLVFDQTGVGAVGYMELDLHVSTRRFIEAEAVPSDAQVVDRTWKYVNKKGGPDRRFSDNRELPVCMYEELQLTTRSGLRELIQISKPGVSASLVRVVGKLAGILQRQSAPPTAQKAVRKVP